MVAPTPRAAWHDRDSRAVFLAAASGCPAPTPGFAPHWSRDASGALNCRSEIP